MEYENNAVIEVDENNLVVYVKGNKIPVTVQVFEGNPWTTASWP